MPDTVFNTKGREGSDSEAPVDVAARFSSLSTRAKTSNAETSESRDRGTAGANVFGVASRSKVDTPLMTAKTALE